MQGRSRCSGQKQVSNAGKIHVALIGRPVPEVAEKLLRSKGLKADVSSSGILLTLRRSNVL